MRTLLLLLLLLAAVPAAAQSVTGAPLTPLPVIPISFCPTGTAGARIQACNDVLVAGGYAGGTIDARALSGSQTAAGFALSAGVQLLLGSSSVTLASSGTITLGTDASIVCGSQAAVIQAVGMGAGTPSLITNADTGAGNSRIRVAGCKVDGNKTGNPASTNVNVIRFIRCANCVVQGVWATNAKGPASSDIRFELGSFNSILNSRADNGDLLGLSIAGEVEWLIQGSIATANTGNGIDAGIGATRGKVIGSESTANGGAGFNPDGSGDLEIAGNNFSSNQNGLAITNPQGRVTVAGNRMDSNTQVGLLITNVPVQIAITGNTITRNGQHGVSLDAAGFSSFVGNLIFDNSTSVDNTYDGIRISNTAGNTLSLAVASNVIGNTGGTGQRYGIAEVSGSGSILGENAYLGNVFWQNRTGTILNSGTSQEIGNRNGLAGSGIIIGPGDPTFRNANLSANLDNAAAGQLTILAFKDANVRKWAIYKDAANGLNFHNDGTGSETLSLSIADDNVRMVGVLSTYANTATAGLGVPVQRGVARLVSQGTALGPTTLFTVGAASAMFTVQAAINCTTTSAAATVQITIGWTDTSSTAQTATLVSAISCTALGASSIGSLQVNIAAKNATAITYTTAIANTPTYDIRIALYQATAN